VQTHKNSLTANLCSSPLSKDTGFLPKERLASTLQQDFVFQWLVKLGNNKQASDGANGPFC